MLFNIIGNALKFTPEGTVTVDCWTVKSPPDVPTHTHSLVISVKDTGIGIGKDAQTRIFEAFEQEDDGDNRVYGGLGLGLAISREVVVAHGGKIVLKSEVTESACAHSYFLS